jgi:hypothetical protein
MDPGTVAVIGLSALLALWYGGGHLYNRRRGRRLFHWLEKGLDVLGGETEAGWIGSPTSGARINVRHAAPPFRRLEITLLLENREILPWWLVQRLRGNRDWLIIKATLRSPRRGEVEVVPAVGQIAQDLLREEEHRWMWKRGPHRLTVAYQGPGAQQQVAALESWLETYGAYLHRLSWRKTDPHIQLQVQAAELLLMPCETFLTDLQVTLKQALDLGN